MNCVLLLSFILTRKWSPYQTTTVDFLQDYAGTACAACALLGEGLLIRLVFDSECAERLRAKEDFVEAGISWCLLHRAFDGLDEALLSGLLRWPPESFAKIVHTLDICLLDFNGRRVLTIDFHVEFVCKCGKIDLLRQVELCQ